MQLRLICLLTLFACTAPSFGASAKVIKVLPHFLDLDGRHSISPSLYDRDAYQAKLRRTPKERSGLRFDIQWRSRDVSELRVRVEMRGGREKEVTQALLETAAKHVAGFSKWTALTLSGDEYRKFGELVAWRVTLLEGDKVISEKKSFLW